MTYKDDMVNQSVERLGALSRRLDELDAARDAIRKEMTEVRGVLKVLGAQDRIPVELTAHKLKVEEPKAAPGSGQAMAEIWGQRRAIDQEVVDKLRGFEGVFRTAKAVALPYGRWHLEYLKSIGEAERVGHGKWRIIKKVAAPPSVKDDTEVAEPLRMIDGIVTTEERPERGYGR